MRVTVFEVEHYPRPNDPGAAQRWESIKTRRPSWAAIEAAIRRLDRAEWPIVWLHTGEPADGYMPEQPALQIMGGRGEYALLSWDGEQDTHYHDESRASEHEDDEPIWIWESAEGAQEHLGNLCNDLPTVLRIARHFAERGEPHPDYRWETW